MLSEMASIHGLSCFTKRELSNSCPPPRHNSFPISPICVKFNSCYKIPVQPTILLKSKNPSSRFYKAVELDRFITSDDEYEEDEMSETFSEAIEELASMTREPSDVLEEMNSRLSARELQLVLVYFSQDGRDSWCALEVFEWLKKENRVDKETMELMVSIMSGWVKNMIESKGNVGEVADLLVDMDCVGLKPSFSMIEKVICLYWDLGEKEKAVLFVKEVLRRGIGYDYEDAGEIGKTCGEHRKTGGPIGYLAWKMMEDGNYRAALKLVIDLRESGLKPETCSYLIAMTAVVKELTEFAKALRKLKGLTKAGLITELDVDDTRLIEEYQSDVLADGVRLSNWVIEGGDPSLCGVVHERLLAMYICAGRGLEAERQLWEMKLVGKEADANLYDIVLAICASQKEAPAIGRLLARMEVTGLLHKKKTLIWLLRGYIKGSHYVEAAETVNKMLELVLWPEFLDRVAVMHGLLKRIQQPGNLKTYLRLCKSLSDAGLVVNCLIYLYIKEYKLWIIKML